MTQKTYWLAEFKAISDAYEYDKLHALKFLPKLRDIHINPTNYAKMKVCYAARVLSNTMSATIRTLIAMKSLPHRYIDTADFVGYINNLFDMMNLKS